MLRTRIPIAIRASACALLCVLFALPIGAAEDNTIILGAAVSLTGKYSTLGKNTRDGYDLAVERINGLGGVKLGAKSYKLKVVYYDDESTSARGAQLVERLISQDGVQFVLGPYSSALTKAIAPVTEKYRVPMIQANGADRALFSSGYRYMFCVLNTADFYLSPALDLVAEESQKKGRDSKSLKVAIAIENDDFSQGVRAGVVERAEKLGMQVVVDDKLPPDLNDMSSTLAKIKALKPDVVMVSGHAKGALLAVRQVSEQRVYAPALALTQCDSAQIDKLGKPAEYALCSAQWDRTLSYSDRWFGTAENYAVMFEKRFNYPITYVAAESSAAVLTFADAIQRAGSLDRDKVRDAIATTDMMTFFGPIKFDTTGKNIAKSMVLYQIQNGKYMVVAPSKWANSKVIYPAPPWDKRP